MRKILTVGCLLVLVSCASRRGPVGPPVPPPIKSIAVVTGDAFTRAVGAELYNQGFKTFELPVTQDMSMAALQALGQRGVDAVLIVKSTKGLDSFPDSASLSLLRTRTGQAAANFNWSNSPGGMPRKNMTESARDLVQTLLRTVPKPT